MVDPVIPKTVHMSIISAYHFGVLRGGIGLGPKNRFKNVVVDCCCVLLLLLLLLFSRRNKKVLRELRC